MMFLNARHHKVSTFGHFRSSGDSGRFVLFGSPEIRLLSANHIHVWAGSKQVPFHTHEKLGHHPIPPSIPWVHSTIFSFWSSLPLPKQRGHQLGSPNLLSFEWSQLSLLFSWPWHTCSFRCGCVYSCLKNQSFWWIFWDVTCKGRFLQVHHQKGPAL